MEQAELSKRITAAPPQFAEWHPVFQVRRRPREDPVGGRPTCSGGEPQRLRPVQPSRMAGTPAETSAHLRLIPTVHTRFAITTRTTNPEANDSLGF
eukprot:2933951-Amphidinium_carterae.1